MGTAGKGKPASLTKGNLPALQRETCQPSQLMEGRMAGLGFCLFNRDSQFYKNDVSSKSGILLLF